MDRQPVRVSITDLSPGWAVAQPNRLDVQVRLVGGGHRTLDLHPIRIKLMKDWIFSL